MRIPSLDFPSLAFDLASSFVYLEFVTGLT